MGASFPYTQAVFGTGPIAHYTDPAGYVLEAPTADTIQLRLTGDHFTAFGITSLNNCTPSSGNTGNVFIFATTSNRTVTGTFCNEGSVLLVRANDFIASTATTFVCQRTFGNANACQRIH
jgi:hypothetical protein